MMESSENSESDSPQPSTKQLPDGSSPLRRGRRPRTKPRILHDFLDHTSRKTNQNKVRENNTSDSDSELEKCKQKVSSLLISEDVEGQDIYKFKSRRTKLDLLSKVNSALNSPQVPDQTPKKSRLSLNTAEETPKHIREKLKKKIIAALESDESNSDFSASGSDFVPEKSEEESSESSEVESDESAAGAGPSPHDSDARHKLRRDTEYVVTPDTYFTMSSSKKAVTSDHTLERLKNYNPSGPMPDFDHLTDEHKARIASLNSSYQRLFNKWLYVLSENYSILLYGFGSKMDIIQKFQAKKLKDYSCIVVNGFFPSLTIKNILEAIVIDLLECSQVPSSTRDTINLIEEKLNEQEMDLFLLIHNIDGPMLQNNKSQSILASLSEIKNVHTVASIDHINAPLIWNQKLLSQFSFTWWDVTTMAPYTAETSFETSLAARGSGALQLASLHSVHRSLTSNAKKVFAIIVEHQLKNHKTSNYQGISFRDLYSKCREQFVVSCDAGLRAQLTEFFDHRLVRSRRGDSDCLHVPIDNALLQHFMDTVSSMTD